MEICMKGWVFKQVQGWSKDLKKGFEKQICIFEYICTFANMSIQFHIVNKDFLHILEDYIKLQARMKKNFADVPDNFESNHSLPLFMYIEE